MRRYSLTKKIFSLGVAIALLSLRLGNLTDEIFVIPVEHAIFDCAFIAEENPTGGKAIKAKLKRMFGVIQTSVDATPPRVETPEQIKRAIIPLLLPRDAPSEIFIPPEKIFLS